MTAEMVMAGRRGKSTALRVPTGMAAGSSRVQDLRLYLWTATYKVAMRKASSRTPAWSQATQQSHTSTWDLSVIMSATKSDIHAQSLARAAVETDIVSSVPVTIAAPQALPCCTDSAQPCPHHPGPWQVAAISSVRCVQPGRAGGFAGRPWNRRRSRGNGKGSVPAGTLHTASSGCRKEDSWP